MSTAGNEKTLMLAAFGLGAFYLLSIMPKRQTGSTGANAFYRAGTVSPAQATQGAGYLTGNSQGAIFNAAGNLINKVLNRPAVYTTAEAGMPHPGAYDTRPYEPYEANFPTSSTQDATPANPVQTYDTPPDDLGQYF